MSARIEPLTPVVPLRSIQDVVQIEAAWGKLIALAAEVETLQAQVDYVGAKVAVDRAAEHLFAACAAMRAALAKARR